MSNMATITQRRLDALRSDYCKLKAQRDELLAALKLVWNDKQARFGVDKITNRPISEIIRAAIANAEKAT